VDTLGAGDSSSLPRLPSRRLRFCRFDCPIVGTLNNFNIGGQFMSHIVSVTTEVRHAVSVDAACRRLRLPPPLDGTHQLYSGRAAGLAVQLPNWRYPVVCELSTGQLHFDDFGGRWGEKRYLDAFLQVYAVERAKIAARKQGHTVTEQQLTDGSIKLTVQVNGGAA
jgi:hypothetical protein